jgi:hypothetical protein
MQRMEPVLTARERSPRRFDRRVVPRLNATPHLWSSPSRRPQRWSVHRPQQSPVHLAAQGLRDILYAPSDDCYLLLWGRLGTAPLDRVPVLEWLTNEEKAMDQSKGEARFPAATSDNEDRKVTWADENSLALEERRVWIEANGLPLCDLQVLKLD